MLSEKRKVITELTFISDKQMDKVTNRGHFGPNKTRRYVKGRGQSPSFNSGPGL